MATIVTRSGKGSPLTNNEVDANFNNLNSGKAELSGATFTGAITANAGVVVDNFTLNGTTLALSSGDMTLDSAGDIILDADGGDVRLKDGGAEFGLLKKDSTRFTIEGPDNPVRIATGTSNIQVNHDTHITFDTANAERLRVLANGDIYFLDNGATSFHYDASVGLTINEAGDDRDFRVESNGNTNMLFVDGGANHVSIGTNSDFGDTFNVSGGGHFSSNVTLSRQTNDTGSTGLILEKTRNTAVNGNTAVQNGDQLGYVAFRGNDGDQFLDGAYVISFVDGTPSNNDMPASLQFWTTADGASSPTLRFKIANDGFGDYTSASNDIIRFGGANSGSITFRNDTSNQFVMHTGTSDDFVIGTGGNNDRLTITAAGAATFSGAVTASGASISGTTNDGSTLNQITQSGTGRGLGVNRNVASATRAMVNLVQGHASGGTQAVLDVQQSTSSSRAIRVTADGTTDRFSVYGTGALVTTPPARGHAVFNEGGIDADFRVESKDNDHMIFVDGNNNRVGIGTGAPATQLDVHGTGAKINVRDLTSAATGVGGAISFQGFTSGEGSPNNFGKIRGTKASGNVGGVLTLSTSATNGTMTDRMTISESGAASFTSDILISGTSVIGKSDDTDTYLQFNLANQLRVVTGGAQRLAVNNSGIDVTGTATMGALAVGGTNTFTSKIVASAANGTAYNSNPQLRISGGGTNYNRASIIFSDDTLSDGKISYAPHNIVANRLLSLSARTTESDFVITGAGNVGVSTTSPTNYGKFAIRGGVTVNAGSTSLTGTSFSTSDAANATFWINHASATTNLVTDASMAFYTASGSGVAERMRISTTGEVTKPYQPAFSVNPASIQSNIAINSQVTIVFGTEVFDVGSNFASNTFTAPVTGKYQLNLSLRLQNADSAASFYQVRFLTSNRSYIISFDLSDLSGDPSLWSEGFSVLADMDASDTVSIAFFQGNGTAQTDIHPESYFTGYLVA